jgi:hypothetical protein
MFKFLSFIGKAIIPIAIILFSILTMLPESTIHTEVLRNDNFYSKISEEVKKNIYILNDENLAKIGSGFPARELLKDNPALTKLYTDAIPKEQVESTVKEIVETQFRTVENTFKNNVPNSNTDIFAKIQNYAIGFYQFRFLLLAAVIGLMILVLISAIFTNNRHFALISKFYGGLSISLVTLLIFTIIGLTGWSFVGSLSREGLNRFLNTDSFSIGLLDTVNWQWAKFVVYLLIPAFAFLILSLFLMAVFGFLSLFQRESMEEKEVKISLKNKPVFETMSNLEAMNNSTIDNRINSYVDDNKYESNIINSEARTEPKKNIFKPISNTPFPIPEPKSRESLDPFLDRLSNSIAPDGTTIDSSKIKVNNDRR